MDQQFLGFYRTAIKAQMQTVEEAWAIWEKMPAQETWEEQGGFKGFLLDYLDKEIKAMYKKAGVPLPE